MASAAALTASAALKSRVRRPSLLKKLAHPEDLIPLFPNGSYIGWSGFTGVGYPKYVSIDSRLDLILMDMLQKDSNDARRPRREEQLARKTEVHALRGSEFWS